MNVWAFTDATGRPPDQPPWDWLSHACSAYTARLTDDKDLYPCHFGVTGQERGHTWFTAVDHGQPHRYGVDALVESLLAFREIAWSGPARQSIVVFVGPPAAVPDLAADHAAFWSLLRQLSDRDPADWPSDRPRDTTDPNWQWCFAGEPWFTFVCSPGYVNRRSRNLGPCLTIVFQTRRVFEGLSGSTRTGQLAKQAVRQRLLSYDAVPPHP